MTTYTYFCYKKLKHHSIDFTTNFYYINSDLNNLLGEAPMETQATAQKCRKTGMGRTGIVELRLFTK